jgi:hypothetical protein
LTIISAQHIKTRSQEPEARVKRINPNPQPRNPNPAMSADSPFLTLPGSNPGQFVAAPSSPIILAWH